MRRRPLIQFLIVIAVFAAVLGGGYLAMQRLLPRRFDTLRVERELRDKLQPGGLLERIIAASRQTLAGKKFDPAVLNEFEKRERRFEWPVRVYFFKQKTAYEIIV